MGRLILLGALLLGAANAAAYVRTTTPAGHPLFWDEDELPVPIHYYQEGLDGIPKARVFAALDRALLAWENLCGVCFGFAYQGLTDQHALAYDGFNSIEFRRHWPHDQDVLALTTVQFAEDGRIIGADIELDAENYRWSLLEPGAESCGRIDIENVVAHELGHVAGLAHSEELQSTMFANAPACETKKRTLHPDDVAGMREIYGCDVRHENCVEGEIGIEEPERSGGGGGGCTQTAPVLPALLPGLLLGLRIWRRRRG